VQSGDIDSMTIWMSTKLAWKKVTYMS